jgi:hypothetical protein
VFVTVARATLSTNDFQFTAYYLFAYEALVLLFLTPPHLQTRPINYRLMFQNCEVFHSRHPTTISMSVLVVVEMFNALNNLSEDSSLLKVTGTLTEQNCLRASLFYYFFSMIPWT